MIIRLCFLGLFSLGMLVRAEAAQPNVLLLLADDQRFDTIAALGNPDVKTPHLDRLATRSYVFSHAYNFGGNAAAVCVPARNMLMTGRTYFRFDDGVRDRGLGPTLPKLLSELGYETYFREKSGTANLPHIRTQFEHREDVDMVRALATGYAARGIVNDAIEFLSKQRNRAKPFFMYLGLPCPHDPRWAAKEFRDLYDPARLSLPPNYRPLHPLDIGSMTVRDERLESWPRTSEAIRRHLHDYYALITSMDHDLGRLFRTLDNEALTERTIVVFSADQGIALGSHGLMGKQNLYEDTQRVPMLFSGPGIPRGRSAALVYLHDLLPTIAELVGARPPSGIDGRSLAGIMAGKAAGVRETLMLAYSTTQRSVRDERWKLIRYPQINRQQLFDLQLDPRETKDLAGEPEYAATSARLTRLLEEEQKRLGDKLPLVATNPRRADFVAPIEKLPTPWPAGGLAPGSLAKGTK